MYKIACYVPEVTKILQFAAQASHELVPPDVSVKFCLTHPYPKVGLNEMK
jgi:hypothetical protein